MPAFHLEFCETELSSKVYPGNHFGGDETAGYVGDAAFHSANVAVKGFFSIAANTEDSAAAVRGD
jgi:hypothetical protein